MAHDFPHLHAEVGFPFAVHSVHSVHFITALWLWTVDIGFLGIIRIFAYHKHLK